MEGHGAGKCVIFCCTWAVADAFALERPGASALLVDAPKLSKALLQSSSPEETHARLEERRAQLSKSERHRKAAASFQPDGSIARCKPKYCMCWFMELCDSDVTTWALSEAERLGKMLMGKKRVRPPVFETIDAWLPSSLDDEMTSA
eukprot:TRINITY_DN27459_c0_g3_i2.p1 TRINITY_DN27459_c0_g3~~TRINITY_DN27459_c0_g3_i2.p1  ORF type:complete len:147 (-),score=30.61 TRINITY_DN27459_c0_g3_i2:275-715(-)